MCLLVKKHHLTLLLVISELFKDFLKSCWPKWFSLFCRGNNKRPNMIEQMLVDFPFKFQTSAYFLPLFLHFPLFRNISLEKKLLVIGSEGGTETPFLVHNAMKNGSIWESSTTGTYYIVASVICVTRHRVRTFLMLSATTPSLKCILGELLSDSGIW